MGSVGNDTRRYIHHNKYTKALYLVTSNTQCHGTRAGEPSLPRWSFGMNTAGERPRKRARTEPEDKGVMSPPTHVSRAVALIMKWVARKATEEITRTLAVPGSSYAPEYGRFIGNTNTLTDAINQTLEENPIFREFVESVADLFCAQTPDETPGIEESDDDESDDDESDDDESDDDELGGGSDDEYEDESEDDVSGGGSGA